MTQTPHQPSRLSSIDLLKGLAIAAVVFLHIQSGLPKSIGFLNGIPSWSLAFNQLLRFSVPLFVAISGYTLTLRYVPQRLPLKQFYFKRFRRIIPLYLLWFAVHALIFQIIPSWANGTTDGSLSQMIKLALLGRIDYHLYFIPLIIQFYLLYPLLNTLLIRWPFMLLAGSFLLQIFTLWQFHHLPPQPAGLTDQERYLLFGSWIWYFTLGMWLAGYLKRKTHQIGSAAFWTLAIVVSFVLMVLDTLLAVNRGQDILDATSFTRYSVMLFASVSLYASLRYQQKFESFPNPVGSWLVTIGRHSFLIYLSHTLILRVVFALTFKPIDYGSLMTAGLILAMAIFLSFRLENMPWKQFKA